MNIELHGFQTNDWSHIIASIFAHLTTADKNVSTETVVTTVQSVTEDGAGTKQPFIRVFSDDKSDFEIARKILPHVHFPGFSSPGYSANRHGMCLTGSLFEGLNIKKFCTQKETQRFLLFCWEKPNL